MVADGSQPVAKGIISQFEPPPNLKVRYLVHGPTRNFGNSQRNFAYKWAHAEWIVHIDDDDIFTEDAFIKIRKAILQSHSDDVFIFKVVAPWGEVVWTTHDIEQGNCCTIQMVLPNHRGSLSRWGPRQGANIPFLKELKTKYSLRWRDEIIAICRPREDQKWFR